MLTDAQVRVLRRKLMEGKRQEGAAAAAGMSVRSAHQWQTGPYPSQAQRPHGWRTRRDPFAAVSGPVAVRGSDCAQALRNSLEFAF